MFKTRRMPVVLFCGLLLVWCMYLQAYADSKESPPPSVVTIEGKITCISCALKKWGAYAQCDLFGHSHGMETRDGTVFGFISNARSQDLLKKEDIIGKDVILRCKVFPRSLFLDVDSYRLDDVWYNWCETCKAMLPGHKHNTK
ncbi:MAG: hypothetical protein HYU64_13225 [Armatimonadetes bacterium]|nr:hypothetical protein [Armatimonadota bacterium]